MVTGADRRDGLPGPGRSVRIPVHNAALQGLSGLGRQRGGGQSKLAGSAIPVPGGGRQEPTLELVEKAESQLGRAPAACAVVHHQALPLQGGPPGSDRGGRDTRVAFEFILMEPGGEPQSVEHELEFPLPGIEPRRAP